MLEYKKHGLFVQYFNIDDFEYWFSFADGNAYKVLVNENLHPLDGVSGKPYVLNFKYVK